MKEKQIDAGQLSEAKKCDLAYQDQRASNSRSLNAIRCLHRGPRYGRYWGKSLLLRDFPCFVRPARSRLEEKSKLVARRGNVVESGDVAVALQVDIAPSIACHAR